MKEKSKKYQSIIKERNKEQLAIFGLIAFWLIIFTIIFFGLRGFKNEPVSIDDVKCIASNSVLYTQEGCRHCENQLEKFGEFQVFLNIIDCTKNNICFKELIGATPTWKINEEFYEGVYSIKELKKMTGCE
jgi:hypothetical protein